MSSPVSVQFGIQRSNSASAPAMFVVPTKEQPSSREWLWPLVTIVVVFLMIMIWVGFVSTSPSIASLAHGSPVHIGGGGKWRR